MPYFVYILECADGTYYTGSTNNLERRLKDHNETKQGARYTKARRPVVLKYSELLSDLSSALKREAELKQLSRQQKTRLILAS